MELLQRDGWEIHFKDNGDIVASFFENPKGYRWWMIYRPLDFMSNLACLDYFKSCGIDIINIQPRGSG